MSLIEIRPARKQGDEPMSQQQVHIVPCLIQPTKSSSISYQDAQQFGPSKPDEWYFHGRRLVPTSLELPKGYQASILTSEEAGSIPDMHDEDEEDEDKQNSRSWSTEINLTGMTLWNHEYPAKTTDVFLQLVNDWMPLASLIHMYPNEKE